MRYSKNNNKYVHMLQISCKSVKIFRITGTMPMMADNRSRRLGSKISILNISKSFWVYFKKLRILQKFECTDHRFCVSRWTRHQLQIDLRTARYIESHSLYFPVKLKVGAKSVWKSISFWKYSRSNFILWKGYLPNLRKVTLLPQFFDYWARYFKF